MSLGCAALHTLAASAGSFALLPLMPFAAVAIFNFRSL
jgi:hypothetical protein